MKRSAYFLYIGSPASKESDDRTEAELDAPLQPVGEERGEGIIREIDESHEPRGRRARIRVDPPYCG